MDDGSTNNLQWKKNRNKHAKLLLNMIEDNDI